MTVGRSDGRTVGRIVVALVWLSVCPPVRLSAQVSFHLGAGGRYTSTLVHDSIVNPIDLRPTLAPALVLSARTPLRARWSVDAALDVSPSGLRRHEEGQAIEAGSFTAIAVTVGLRRALAAGIATRVGVGGLVYAADRAGVFREGSGGLFPLGTVALTYTPPLGGRRRLELEARYDVHRFITRALRTEGYTDPRSVHRLAIAAQIGLSGSP